MALTFVVTNILVRGSALGGRRLRLIKITGDSSYADGGYAITAANCNFDNGLDTVIPIGCMGPEGTGVGITLVPQWDSTNKKMKLFKTIASGAAVQAAAGDPNGLFLNVLAIGF